MWTGESAQAGARRGSRARVAPECGRAGACGWLASLALLTSCSQEMANQPKYTPLRPSSFFEDGNSARPLVEGAVARGQLRDDPLLYFGRVAVEPPPGAQAAGGLSREFPFPVTLEVLERGEERFNIFCAVCHDRAGTGNGMVVQRGYRHPPSYHTDRLRQAPAGYIFDVISNGFGAMPDYASQIPPRDRWAIVAHVRALQLSQNARLEDLPAETRRQLEGAARK